MLPKINQGISIPRCHYCCWKYSLHELKYNTPFFDLLNIQAGIRAMATSNL